jgi:hypothetical protein
MVPDTCEVESLQPRKSVRVERAGEALLTAATYAAIRSNRA